MAHRDRLRQADGPVGELLDPHHDLRSRQSGGGKLSGDLPSDVRAAEDRGPTASRRQRRPRQLLITQPAEVLPEPCGQDLLEHSGKTLHLILHVTQHVPVRCLTRLRDPLISAGHHHGRPGWES